MKGQIMDEEMAANAVRARLTELHARIEMAFENDEDRQYVLEHAQQEIADLLRLLGVSLAGAE